MIFGKDGTAGFAEGAHPEVVTIGENGITETDLLVHDIISRILQSRYVGPHGAADFPQPVGIFRAVERPTYEEMMVGQIDAASRSRDPAVWRNFLIAATPGPLNRFDC